MPSPKRSVQPRGKTPSPRPKPPRPSPRAAPPASGDPAPSASQLAITSAASTRLQWIEFLGPADVVEQALVEQAAYASERLSRLRACERARLDRALRRHEQILADQLADSLDELIERLPLEPARVSSRIERFEQGCLWKIRRWARLRHSLLHDGCWTLDELAETLQLLGLSCDGHRQCLRAWRLTCRHQACGGLCESQRDVLPDQAPSPMAPAVALAMALAIKPSLRRQRTAGGDADRARRDLHRLIDWESRRLCRRRGELRRQHELERQQRDAYVLVDVSKSGQQLSRQAAEAGQELARSLRLFDARRRAHHAADSPCPS